MAWTADRSPNDIFTIIRDEDGDVVAFIPEVTGKKYVGVILFAGEMFHETVKAAVAKLPEKAPPSTTG